MVTQGPDGANGGSLHSPTWPLLGMIAPLYIEELNHLACHDTVILIQDLDGVLEICQVRLKRCHVKQYNIHGCLRALL
jgi:hypothetical protein